MDKKKNQKPAACKKKSNYPPDNSNTQKLKGGSQTWNGVCCTQSLY